MISIQENKSLIISGVSIWDIPAVRECRYSEPPIIRRYTDEKAFLDA